MARRGSLAGVKTSQLRKRCVAAGVSEEDLEEADDADDSHAALVELLLAAHEQVEQAHEQVEPDAGLRAELEGMRKGALRKRAVAAMVDESALEAADDAEDSRAALVALVLEQEAAGSAAAGDRARVGPAGRMFSALKAGGAKLPAAR